MAWLERTLAAFKGTVVAVTHDRCVAWTYIPPRVSPTCTKLECCACLGPSSEAAYEAAYAAEHAGGSTQSVVCLRGVLAVVSVFQPHGSILPVWHCKVSTLSLM